MEEKIKGTGPKRGPQPTMKRIQRKKPEDNSSEFVLDHEEIPV